MTPKELAIGEAVFKTLVATGVPVREALKRSTQIAMDLHALNPSGLSLDEGAVLKLIRGTTR